nr:PREDICTED: uncharacterized protein LOC102364666 [Latimeria chalumnae]|eukprot:XP_014351889.1 PREDICTED: uncharacterized protein LOC102364666 [Latimeria chalumnae]
MGVRAGEDDTCYVKEAGPRLGFGRLTTLLALLALTSRTEGALVNFTRRAVKNQTTQICNITVVPGENVTLNLPLNFNHTEIRFKKKDEEDRLFCTVLSLELHCIPGNEKYILFTNGQLQIVNFPWEDECMFIFNENNGTKPKIFLNVHVNNTTMLSKSQNEDKDSPKGQDDSGLRIGLPVGSVVVVIVLLVAAAAAYVYKKCRNCEREESPREAPRTEDSCELEPCLSANGHL